MSRLPGSSLVPSFLEFLLSMCHVGLKPPGENPPYEQICSQNTQVTQESQHDGSRYLFFTSSARKKDRSGTAAS